METIKKISGVFQDSECSAPPEKEFTQLNGNCSLPSDIFSLDLGFSSSRKHFVKKTRKSNREAFIFKCMKCNFSTRSRVNLKRHKAALHSQERPFICSHCSFSFKLSCILARHIKRKHTGMRSNSKPNKEKNLCCPHCNFQTAYSSSLKDHLGYHSNKFLNCKQCSYKTKSIKCLSRHRLKHMPERRFKCDECNYSCNDRSSINKHKALHTGIKKYACSRCSYITADSSNFNRHVAMHHKADKTGKRTKRQSSSDLPLVRRVTALNATSTAAANTPSKFLILVDGCLEPDKATQVSLSSPVHKSHQNNITTILSDEYASNAPVNEISDCVESDLHKVVDENCTYSSEINSNTTLRPAKHHFDEAPSIESRYIFSERQDLTAQECYQQHKSETTFSSKSGPSTSLSFHGNSKYGKKFQTTLLNVISFGNSGGKHAGNVAIIQKLDEGDAFMPSFYFAESVVDSEVSCVQIVVDKAQDVDKFVVRAVTCYDGTLGELTEMFDECKQTFDDDSSIKGSHPYIDVDGLERTFNINDDGKMSETSNEFISKSFHTIDSMDNALAVEMSDDNYCIDSEYNRCAQSADDHAPYSVISTVREHDVSDNSSAAAISKFLYTNDETVPHALTHIGVSRVSTNDQPNSSYSSNNTLNATGIADCNARLDIEAVNNLTHVPNFQFGANNIKSSADCDDMPSNSLVCSYDSVNTTLGYSDGYGSANNEIAVKSEMQEAPKKTSESASQTTICTRVQEELTVYNTCKISSLDGNIPFGFKEKHTMQESVLFDSGGESSTFLICNGVQDSIKRNVCANSPDLQVNSRRERENESDISFVAPSCSLQPLCCHSCELQFASLREINEHVYLVHSLKNLEPDHMIDISEEKVPSESELDSVISKSSVVQDSGGTQALVDAGDVQAMSCETCNLQTFDEKELLLHACTGISYFVSKNGYKCTLCNFNTQFKAGILEHMRLHSNYEDKTDKVNFADKSVFSCRFCNFKTTKKRIYNAHCKCHLPEKPFQCSLCQFRTNYKNSLKNHVKLKHGTRPSSKNKCLSSEAHRHHCQYCDFSTVHYASYRRHTRKHLRLAVKWKGKDASTMSCSQCQYCSKTFSDKLSLLHHVAIHNDEKRYLCKICGYRTDLTAILKLHVVNHLKSSTVLSSSAEVNHFKSISLSEPSCSKSVRFLDEEALLQFTNITPKVSKDTKCVQCKFCSFRCCGRSTLIRHRNKEHPDHFPVRCSICSFVCKDRKTLKQHKSQEHAAELPFSCRKCLFRSKTRYILVKHEAVHEKGRTTFSCNRCPFRGATKSSIVMHMKRHSSDVEDFLALYAKDTDIDLSGDGGDDDNHDDVRDCDGGECGG